MKGPPKSKFTVLCATFCLIGALLSCGGGAITPAPMSSTGGFRQTNLVSDSAGTAAHTDPFLLNPWGFAFQPGQSFFIADNNRGSAKVFDPSGNPDIPSVVGIPAPSGSALPSAPTGIVSNPVAQDFLVRGTPAQFLLATEDGTISTWATINGNFPTNALLARDDSARGAVSKSRAILTPQCCREYLALANFHNGFIATYDINFNLLATTGSFKDSNLPAGYPPFNIQQIGTEVFVTYAVQDATGTSPLVVPGNGIVSVFDQEGNFTRFASNGPLNAPWGIVQASANFGRFSNDILIGNFGDGTINAFDPTTGNFLGQLKDSSGKVITNPGLWALVFRSDGVGNPDTLYFTAGSSGEDHGLFGAILSPAVWVGHSCPTPLTLICYRVPHLPHPSRFWAAWVLTSMIPSCTNQNWGIIANSLNSPHSRFHAPRVSSLL